VIVVTAGLLQGPFYNASRPAALNYGSIGVVMAHEITHGYDNSGRLHDENGAVRDWWANSTKENFIRRKKCFIQQYGDIEVPDTQGLHINGELTQGENIADNGGMRAAYSALERFLEPHKEQPPSNRVDDAEGASVAVGRKLRGLEQFNARQLFFLNYAFSWCSKERSESTIFNLLTDRHAPNAYRVNVVLSNIPAFAEQFQCKPGTRMNPEKKCAVW